MVSDAARAGDAITNPESGSHARKSRRLIDLFLTVGSVSVDRASDQIAATVMSETAPNATHSRRHGSFWHSE